MHPDVPDIAEPAQLLLITPPLVEPAAFRDELAAALSSGSVAAVLVASGRTEEEREAAALAFVPLIQAAGAAAIVADFTRVAGRSKADGVHIESGAAELRSAVESFRPRRIVGAGGLRSRHEAMEAGEAEPDYLLFGRLHGDTHPEPHAKMLDLAEWWSDLMEIPAVVMAGNTLGGIAAAAQTGAPFIGVHDAIWKHPGGPSQAVAQALGMLRRKVERAA